MESIHQLADAILQPVDLQSQCQHEQGLNIYRLNYLLNHVDILAENFSAVKNIFGMENFRFFAKRYLYEFPPSNPNIEVYGDGFATFLANQRELKEVPHFAEIAKIDWLWTKRFNNPHPVATWSGVLPAWHQATENEYRKEIEIDPQRAAKVSLYDKGAEFELEEHILIEETNSNLGGKSQDFTLI